MPVFLFSFDMSGKFRYFICLILLTSSLFLHINAAEIDENSPILIISSYNPDAQNIAANISEFIEEYTLLGGKNTVTIENMNCRSFSESILWKTRMEEILAKYEDINKPEFIILLGQEAWASYLSQENDMANVPVLCAMVSRNGVILPDSTVSSLKKWMPESVDFLSDTLKRQVKGGLIYEYDVDANVQLIKKTYPNTQNIAFISDNTYGGVSLQAHVIKEMQKYPDLNLILLDGRSNTIYTIVEELRTLPENTAVIIGTWRVDENDGYFMRNATYAMMEVTPNIPVFSMSTIGLGYWTIGGVTPNYRGFGKDIAHQICYLQQHPNDKTDSQIVLIDNKLRLDYNKVKELHLNTSLFPSDTIYVNKAPSFYEMYKYQIWFIGSFLIVLTTAFIILLYFYFRTKKLKDELEISEAQLRTAKDNAEESSRLKSAFLANMSHEIRTPLNAIVGFSNVLIMGEASEEEQQSYFEIIRTNSDLLLRLINDILDISRLEANKVSFSYEKCDIIQLMQQVLTSVDYAKETTNQFIFKSKYSTFEFETDVQRLQQVVINLLSNAGKFTNNGTITLEFDAEEESDCVLFSVSDTGIGIPLEKQDIVFERFEKLDEYAQGTGLGLSICKLIVTRLGGDIWVDPDYTQGARFVFSHPIKHD